MAKTIKTNDIKKGTRIKLANGWFATMEDNKKGNIRMATVEGFSSDTGSVYSHNIVSALVDGEWVAVEHTPAQNRLRQQVSALGF